MNYLQLCQGFVSELGLSGAGPNKPGTVIGNTILELANVARWVRDACFNIDNQWLDWKYHWTKYAQSASAGAQTLPALPAPALVRVWDINKIRYRTTGVASSLWQPVSYYTRQRLETQFDTDNAIPGPPTAFTVNPDNSVQFASPFDVPYDFRGELWRRPTVLTNDTDEPDMPAEHHRIILCRAAIMYGNREDAPEIISGMEAEYIDMLDKLESDQLEGFALRRTSTDRERRLPGTYHEFLV